MIAAPLLTRPGPSHPGHPRSAGLVGHRLVGRVPAHAELATAAAIEWLSTLTMSARQARARSVIASTCSDQVLTAHNSSGHCHRRRANANTTGRPAIGRPRVRTRPWPTARLPQPEQPTTSAVVSTYNHHSPSISTCAPTPNPAIPTRAVAPSLPLITASVSPSPGVEHLPKGEALDRAGGPMNQARPSPDPTGHRGQLKNLTRAPTSTNRPRCRADGAPGWTGTC